MRNFQDIFETRKRSLNDAFTICMTVPLSSKSLIPVAKIADYLELFLIYFSP